MSLFSRLSQRPVDERTLNKSKALEELAKLEVETNEPDAKALIAKTRTLLADSWTGQRFTGVPGSGKAVVGAAAADGDFSPAERQALWDLLGTKIARDVFSMASIQALTALGGMVDRDARAQFLALVDKPGPEFAQAYEVLDRDTAKALAEPVLRDGVMTNDEQRSLGAAARWSRFVPTANADAIAYLGGVATGENPLANEKSGKTGRAGFTDAQAALAALKR